MVQPDPTAAGTTDRIFTFVRIVNVHFPSTLPEPAPFPLEELTEEAAREALQNVLVALANLTDQSTWALAADQIVDFDNF